MDAAAIGGSALLLWMGRKSEKSMPFSTNVLLNTVSDVHERGEDGKFHQLSIR